MEEEQRLFHTPTPDLKLLVPTHITNQRYSQPNEDRLLTVPAPFRINRGGNKKFINSRTFSTLTTQLSATDGLFGGHKGEDGVLSNPGEDSDFKHAINSENPTKSPERDSCERDHFSSCGTLPFKISVNSDSVSRSTPDFVPGQEDNKASNTLLPETPVCLRPIPGRQGMGSLLKHDSPLFGHTDSLGFQVTKDVPFKQDSERCNTDLTRFEAETNVSPHNQNHQVDCSGDSNVFGRGQVLSVASEQSFQDETSSVPGVNEPEEPMQDVEAGREEDLRLNPSEDFHFQKLDSVPRPPLRRQLSKRKSDVIFGVPLPPVSVHENDNDEDDSEGDDDDFYSLGGSTGRQSDPCTPTSPKARRLENYDPYQIFEVQHTPCMILTVRVLRGRNITNGFQDFLDTPDPYINLVLKTSPEGRKSTSVKQNNPNPVWDETFTFFINFQQVNILEITLMESNMFFDQEVGSVPFDISEIRETEKSQLETFVFNGVSQIDIEFKMEFDRNPTLRYSLCLSEQEKAFIERRKEKALEGMRRLLGEEDGPMNTDEVPTIAVIGSGGGFRAMTGYSGVFKALSESGVIDCAMYACGLSGSSWLVSTLYSHPKWPNLDMKDFVEELKLSVDKSLFRFLNVSTMYNYARFMIQKRKEGQPVSFTDIFGRMVGETLLNGRMETTLSDQREKLKDGACPMPLYTCVHVKKDVPAMSFQEWVEFSPYEIGLPKYGTFMDSELFGSKFFMGKLVKKFNEQPLHFLQGIWGSAFCILFKRLLEDNRRIDPVEMVRQEMTKQLDEARQESSSDCSDDDVDDLSSFDSSTDSDLESVKNVNGDENSINNGSFDNDFDRSSDDMQADDRSQYGPTQKLSTFDVRSSMEVEMDRRRNSSESKMPENMNMDRRQSSVFNTDVEVEEDTGDGDSAYAGEEEDAYEDDDDISDKDESENFSCHGILKRGSVELKRAKRKKQTSKDSASPENDTVDHFFLPQAIDKATASTSNNELETSLSASRKSVNWGVCPKRANGNEPPDSQKRRQAYSRAASSMRKSRNCSKSYWKKMIKGVFESNSWELLSTRRGRAAVIHNFMRGLSLQQSYPLSPFTPVDERVKAGDEFDGIFEMHPTNVKHIYMVDAGLTFNSPFPLILRPQREVDIILSFDFSARPGDQHQPFKELLLAEKWARLNRLPFPPIDASVFEREGMKELYIFRHPTNPHCPIVFHFVLLNKRFKYYKKPGVPRETKEDFDFAEFDVFDDPKAPFSTFNFTYTNKNFERMSQLMEFNTLLHIDEIKEVIKDVIKQKRDGPPRLPIQSKDIKLLRMKSVQEMRRLRRFITRMESRNSFHSGTSPSTPFFTPTPNGEVSTNPFFSGFHRDVSLSSSNDASTYGTPRDRLSESFSRSSRGKKHLQPPSVFSESEELNYLQTSQNELRRKSNSSFASSSIESVFETPQKSSDPIHNFGQSEALDQLENNLAQEPFDVCDGPLEESSEPKAAPLEEKESKSKDVLHEPSVTCQPVSEFFTQTTADIVTSKKPMLSPKKKISGTAFPFSDNVPKLGTTDSGFGSLGIDMSSSGSVNDGFGHIIPSIAKTPVTGSLSSSNLNSDNLSGQVLSKGKSRKDSPPNPFFAKALFMRSPNSHGTSTSSSSSSSALPQTEPFNQGKAKTLRGSSYRLSPLPSPEHASSSQPYLNSQVSAMSPLLTSIANSSLANSSLAHSPNSPPETPTELYSLAPEAFRKDGTPVFDSQEAKMYYEAVKDRRKILRRQSTVSSLSSISLDENEGSREEVNVKNHATIDKDYKESQKEKLMYPAIDKDYKESQKEKLMYPKSHFQEFYLTCDDGMGEETISEEGLINKKNSNTESIASNQTISSNKDCGVDFEIDDLSKFTAVQERQQQNRGQREIM